jgi:hypothetical protein
VCSSRLVPEHGLVQATTPGPLTEVGDVFYIVDGYVPRPWLEVVAEPEPLPRLLTQEETIRPSAFVAGAVAKE